jgi:hypothetical protein
MRRTIHFIICACMLTVGVNMSRSQGITIDSNDVKSMYTVGKTITYHLDNQTTSMDIGLPGGPRIWDFSNLKTSKQVSRTSVPVKTSPYAAEFPQATVAVLDTAFTYRLNTGTLGLGWGTIKSSAAYAYYSLGDGLRYYGIGAVASGYLDSAPAFPIPITDPRWVTRPPALQYSLPLEYSKGWASNYADSLIGKINFLGVYDVRIGNTDSVTYLVDAYGTLITPGGQSQEALRIRKVGRHSFVDTVNNLNTPLQYTFLARNGASVEVGIDDTTVTSGVTTVRYARWNGPLPVGVRTISDVPSTFGLDQNYPNPFNPVTNIGFRVSGQGSSVVRLGVYDMLGREVALLVDERKPAGEYRVEFNGSGLASGIYHYRLTAAGDDGILVETKSMMLVK